MDINVNGVQGVSQVDSVQKTETAQGENFKFTLLSKVEETELRTKLNTMIESITEQGDKIAKHMDISDRRK